MTTTLLVMAIFVFPVGTKAALNEQDITILNNTITKNQQVIDDLTKQNLEHLNTIAEQKKAMSTWKVDSDLTATIKEFNATIANNNRLIRISKERVLASEKELQLVLIANARTPAEKVAAQKRYDEIVKDRKANLVKMLNETKIEGAVDDASCAPSAGGINIGNCMMRAAGWMGNLISYLFASLLFLSSKIFDAAVFMSITMTSTWFINNAVSSAWTLIRDFANIFFVFIMLYVAIGSIFELGGIGDPKRLLAHVIIVALLVNFSGFFVRVVVDASNIVAYEFYQSMSGTGSGNVFEFKTIGTELVKKLQLDKLYNTNKPGEDPSSTVILEPQINRLSFVSIILQTFGNIFIFLAVAFVLLVASALFIIRTVVLLIVYIVSPFAFMSQIIPGSRFNYFRPWINYLVSQALFAPAFLIPLYVVFLILGEGGISSVAGTSSTSGWGIAGGGSGTLILVNVIILGLVISCIFIAQKIGAVGAEVVPGLASSATALAARPLSRYGGRLAGRAGSAIAGTGTGKALAESWNTGRLSRVRQSWDTGVLRGARDTAAAQRVGQAVRTPLTTIGAGIGAAAGAAGIRGVGNVFGATPFSRQVEQRASTYLADMRKRERPEDRARFLEGLAGTTGREEFNAIYSQLTPQERRELETAAGLTNVDMAKRLEEQRLNLRGKAGQQTAIEQVQNNKTAGANIMAVEHLNPEDLNAVYRALTPQQRAQLEKDAAANPTLTANLAAARTALGKGGSRETLREADKAQRLAAAETELAVPGGLPDPMVAFNTGSPATSGPAMDRVNKIRELRGEEFKDFAQNNNIFDGSPDHRSLYPYLSAEQLRIALTEVGHAERQEIRRRIEKFRPHGTPHATDNTIEQAYQYLNDPVRGGTSF